MPGASQYLISHNNSTLTLLWENSGWLANLPNRTQLIKGRAGIGFWGLSDSRNPCLSTLPSLPKQSIPLLLQNCWRCQQENETGALWQWKEVTEPTETELECSVCLDWREMTASLPSHRHKNDLGYQRLSLFASQNWVRYSSSENGLFSAPAVIWATQLGGGLQLASWAQSSRSLQLTKQHMLASPSRREERGVRETRKKGGRWRGNGRDILVSGGATDYHVRWTCLPHGCQSGKISCQLFMGEKLNSLKGNSKNSLGDADKMRVLGATRWLW